MKSNYLSNKLLFFVPLFFLLACTFFFFNNNFYINGGNYEVLVMDAVILFTIFVLFHLLIYFLFSFIIKNKIYIFFLEIILFSFILLNIPLLVFVPILFFLVYRKDNNNINYFFNVFSVIFSFTVAFLFVYNGFQFIYYVVSFYSREHDFTIDKKVKVSKDTDSPNIYWIHMDGMPSIEFINKYYGDNLEEFTTYLDNNNYIVNKDASFSSGYHTMMALNALFNPSSYDKDFKDYIDNYYKCLKNKCKTEDIATFNNLINNRFNNELFKSFEKKGYSTVSIAEYNQYTSFNATYIYDIFNLKDNKNIRYFNNNYSDSELYNYVLKIHYLSFINNIFNTNYYPKYKNTKNISYDIDLDKYPLINKSNYVEMKAMIKAIEDSRNKDNNSKLYFLDNTITHLYWKYDENGKLISLDNNNLDDFSSNYIYTCRLLMEFLNYLRESDPEAVIVVQGDHGIHAIPGDIMMDYYDVDMDELLDIRDSTISFIYVPEKYKNNDEKYLNNPLNISRYLINSFVGNNYEYLK